MMILFSRKFGFVLFCFILSIPLSFSQNPERDTVKQYGKSYSEELFVKTDREIYIAGEMVWLKIYKLNGLTHKPDNISKVVYIDILDLRNNPVKQMKIPVNDYSGSTGFRLPDTLNTGYYVLRSYTNWMQNFPKELFSYKRISVINPFENIDKIRIPSFDNIPERIIFYPEGNHLIAGIRGELGFRSVNRNGEPVMMNGVLINDNNDTICHVQSGKNGYGRTFIEPVDTTRITLVTTTQRGIVKKFPIPVIQSQGISISVTKESDNSTSLIKINKSQNFTYPDDKLSLSFRSAGLTYFKKELGFNNENEIILSWNDLPYGLSHLIISDNQDNLLTERWIYNETNPLINYDIDIQSGPFNSREKVKIDISASDSDGIPVESDLSISIVKSFTSNQGLFDNSRYRQLAFLSTVKRDVPGSDINDHLIFYAPEDQIIDQDTYTDKDTPYYIPELEGHLISGNIRDRQSGEPLKNENITLSYVGKSALCQFSKTDEKGDFNFLVPEHGLREIVIQPLSSEIKNCFVELRNPFNISFNNYDYGEFYLDSSKLTDVNNAIISMQIKNIYEPFSQGEIKSSDLPEMSNFYGSPDNTIEMSRYIELTSLREVVKEIIPGVSTVKKNDEINFKLVNKFPGQPFENNPFVLVDGVPIYDLEKVININSGEIEKIDVLNTRYFIGEVVLEGILNFISKRGNLSVIDFDRSVFRQEYELLQDVGGFYIPDYSSSELKNNRIPDFRNTLFWDPDLHTDRTGKTSVEFYTSDEPGEYVINVEGITSDGKTGTSSIPIIIRADRPAR